MQEVAAPNMIKIQPRLVVVESVYHQLPNKQPITIQGGYLAWLKDVDQVFIRELTVGEGWHTVADSSWLKTPSLLHLRNEEGKYHQVQPTAQEREDAAKKIIEIAVDGKVFSILRPGHSQRFEPLDVTELCIRCRAGTARCVITLFPG